MKKHYHFVGIGGIGMSGIALIMLRRGFKVSGSDLKSGQLTDELARQGAEIYLGHRAENISGAQTLVYSSAIKEDNPEIVAAKSKNIPIIKRAQALAALMQDKTVITVTGSHGKTTTTSLISFMLEIAGLCPTCAVGGILKNMEKNALCGNGEFFVAEADESDGSFLYYHPKYSVITNIDREHLDYYHDFDNEIKAFKDFLGQTVNGGCVFACSDDTNLMNILKNCKHRCITFGLNPEADIFAKNIKLDGLSSEFDCFYKGQFVARFKLALAGEHNISNALSVIALGLELKINVEVIKKALMDYRGSGRRIEVKFRNKDYLVIDDYAHHPTEIRATLAALKNLNPRRLVAAFQPHRYSRTQLLLDEFSQCFNAVDLLAITDIYAASEQPIEGVNAGSICDSIKKYFPLKNAEFIPKENLARYILDNLQPGDLIVTLGAGDITKISDEIAHGIKERMVDQVSA